MNRQGDILNGKNGLVHLLIASMMVISTLGFILPMGIIENRVSATEVYYLEIDYNETWNISGSPYYINRDVVILSNGALNIEPGVQVLFNAAYSIYVEGYLNATGTSSSKVKFASNFAGSWNAIKFNATGKGKLDYCDVSGANYGVHLDNNKNGIPIDNCYFHKFSKNGVYVQASNTNITSTDFKNSNYAALKLDSLSNATIDDIYIANVDHGIVVDNCGSITIKNSEIYNNADANGIMILSTDNVTIEGNEIHYHWGAVSNVHNGIYIENSDNVTIANNSIYDNNRFGIVTYNSDGITIYNNTVNNNDLGGVHLYDSTNHKIYNNTIKYNHGQDIPCSCGIYFENVNHSDIKNNDITENEDTGIHINKGSHNNTIENNNVSKNEFDGVYIINSKNNRVINNIIDDNNWGAAHQGGVRLQTTEGTIITDNKINSNTEYGIYIGSDDVMISNNQINENTYDGIFAFKYYENITILENQINSNSGEGVNLTEISMATISENDLNGNTVGLSLMNDDNITVTYNTINMNDYGILLSPLSENCQFYNNTIADRIRTVWDPSGNNNTWDYNYYSDYDGADLDNNWIGETKNFTVPGGTGYNDTHPRTKIDTTTNSDWHFAMIQTAVNYSTNGSTIYMPAETPEVGSSVYPQHGYYPEPVFIDDFSSLYLKGEAEDLVTVDGWDHHVCFYINNSKYIAFSDMTITQGGSHGIYYNNKTSIDINNCNITYCKTNGVYGDYSSYDSQMLISNATGNSNHPMPVIDRERNIHIVWSYNKDIITYSMYSPSGDILIDDTPLNEPDGYSSTSPMVVADSKNMLHVIWADKKSDKSGDKHPQLHYTKIDPSKDDKSGDNASEDEITVVDDKAIVTNQNFKCGGDVDIEIDSSDNIHIVFVEKNYDRLYYMKLDVNGQITFGPKAYVTNVNEHWPRPQLELDSSGDLHILWSEDYSTGDNELFYMMLDGSNGNVLIDRTKITADDDEDSKYQQMVIDSADKLHLIWEDYRRQSDEIFYAKLDPSLDDQNGDSAKASVIKIIGDKLLTPDDDEDTGIPVVKIDSSNNIHIVYYENDELDIVEGERLRDIWYMQIDDTGKIIYEPDWISLYGFAQSKIPGYTYPYFVLDSNNNPHITWCDNRTEVRRIAYYRPGDLHSEDMSLNSDDSTFWENGRSGIEIDFEMFDVDLDIDLTNSRIMGSGELGFWMNAKYMNIVDMDIDHVLIAGNQGEIQFATGDMVDTDFNFEMTNSVIRDGANGLYFNTIYSKRNVDVYMSDNKFVDIEIDGVYYDECYGNLNMIIENNEFENLGDSPGNIGFGWNGPDHLYSDSGPYQFILDVEISDNSFKDIEDTGIYTDMPHAKAGSIKINNNDMLGVPIGISIYGLNGNIDLETNYNTIKNCGNYGIVVSDGGSHGPEYGTFNWDLKYNSISGDCDGIYFHKTIEYGSLYLNISENYLDGCSDSIYLDEVYYSYLEADLFGNVFDSCSDGIYIEYFDCSDAVINIVDTTMTDIEDEAFTFQYLGDSGTNDVEINIINAKVIGYGEAGIYMYRPTDEGNKVHMTIKNCEFRYTPSYIPTYFMEIEEIINGYSIIDIYDTTVVGYDDSAFYFDEYDDEGTMTINIYESYFNDKGWPDLTADYDIELDSQWNVYFNIYNTEGITSTDLDSGPSSVTWYWDCDVQVYTGTNLNKPAPNVDIEFKDKYGNTAGGGTTDKNGQLNNIYIKSQRHELDKDSNEFFTYYTPHTVTASNGLASVSKNVKINQEDTKVVLYLTGDADADGFNDLADSDDDNDGHSDNEDAFPNNPNEWLDTDNDGVGNNADLDDDGDGVADSEDSFPTDPKEWSDIDSDGIGDNSDADTDGDGWSDKIETEAGSDPKDSGSRPSDIDGDNIADIYDTDIDGDNVTNSQDKFPYDGSEWLDTDGDGIGDNADPDADNDGYPDTLDAFPLDPNEWSDTDSDGIGDNTDKDIDGDGWSNDLEKSAGSNPYDAGSVPADLDGDGIPDIYDTDIDGDGVENGQDAFPRDASETADRDGDGIGDNTDNDDDNDGYTDSQDKYPNNPKEWADSDGDGVGDNSDSDSDNDGYPDVKDEFPTDPDEWKDSDGDGQGDKSDPDRDGDGVNNDLDDFPDDKDEAKDSDGDGLGDNRDPDDDNDGKPDVNDEFPNDPDEWKDSDGDGLGDGNDTDLDGDGVLNENDKFPNNPREFDDSDNDGIGDNIDIDDDNDGVPDVKDAFPYDENESLDTDGDGLGDNSDPDDDGDGIPDVEDKQPLIPNIGEEEEEETKVEEVGQDIQAAQEQLNYIAILGLIMLIILIIVLIVKKPKAAPAPPPREEEPVRQPSRSREPSRRSRVEEEFEEDEEVDDWGEADDDTEEVD